MIGYIIVDEENRDVRSCIQKKIYRYQPGEDYLIEETEGVNVCNEFLFYITIEDCIFEMIGTNNCKNIMQVEILGDIIKHEKYEAYYTNYIHIINFLDKDRLFCALKKKIKNLDLLNKEIDEYNYEEIVKNDIEEFLHHKENYIIINNILYWKHPVDKVCRKVNLRELKQKMHSNECLHYCLTLDEAQHYIDLNEDLAYKICEYYGLQNSTSIKIDDAIRNYYIDKWIEKLNN